MAARGRPTAELALTEEERQTLVRWSRRAKSSQALALRSRIILAYGEGLSNKAVTAKLDPRGKQSSHPGPTHNRTFTEVVHRAPLNSAIVET